MLTTMSSNTDTSFSALIGIPSTAFYLLVRQIHHRLKVTGRAVAGSEQSNPGWGLASPSP